MIENKELTRLLKECKSEKDIQELIIKGINEEIKMTNKQLIRLVKKKAKIYELKNR